MLNESMGFFLRYILTISVLTLPSFVCGQAILPERVWTNTNGKKIRAELLGFNPRTDQGTVRLRMKGGNIFKLKPESLSREDQAVILKARFNENFRARYNENTGAHFFYSKQVPQKDDDKIVAYIGNDHESAWVRLKVNAHRDLVEDGKKVLLMAGNEIPIRIPYSDEDIEHGRFHSTIDLSLTKYGTALTKLFARPDKIQVLIEAGSDSFTEIKLTRPEKLGLKEIADTYLTLSKLTTDHVWWTTFQGLDPEEFKKLAEQKAMEEAPQKVEDTGPVLPLQEWNDGQRTFMAEVSGFDRHFAIFKLEDGKKQSIPVVDISREGREQLVAARQNRSIYQTWHPYDDEFTWYWPKTSTDPAERIEKRIILYAKNRETGEPGLFLQQRYDTDSAIDIASCKLKAPKVYLDVDFPDGGRVLKLRGRTSTKVWYHISGEIAELLLVAAPGIESFEYEITPAEGEAQRGKFNDEEFRMSIEALEIYRIEKSLAGEK